MPSSIPVSPSTDFQPRKEFAKTTTTHHAFGLLSFNGSEILRLANFPDYVTDAVRKALSDEIRHFREDPILCVSEFILAGKPFSGRSLRQEQILLDIFSAVLSQQFTLVSSLDYGRIHLDKLTLAFKRPLVEPMTLHSLAHNTFGISFLSTTSLRVVSPPLSVTPAVLQVVRGAWPHGVVSEKRDGDGSFTFKLKGYSMFQQSTFEKDSLANTLDLIRGMDAHGFSLVTSISLSKRSRIQDLWIFSIPTHRKLAGSPNSLDQSLKGRRALHALEIPTGPPRGHSMISSDDSDGLPSALPHFPMPPQSRAAGHTRSSSTPNALPAATLGHTRNHSTPPNIIGSPGRRGSVSRKAVPPIELSPAASPVRAQQPSGIIQRDNEKSTSPNGNGTFNPVQSKSATSPVLPAEYPSYPPNSMPLQPYPNDHQSHGQVLYVSPTVQYNQVPSTAFQTPGLPPLNADDRWPQGPSAVPVPIPTRPDPKPQASWNTSGEEGEESEESEGSPTPPLLPSGAFRNTAFSATTYDSDVLRDIPVVWSGPGATLGLDVARQQGFKASELRQVDENRLHYDTVEIRNDEENSPVLLRSPRRAQPDLEDVDDTESWRHSEKPFLGIVTPNLQEKDKHSPPESPRATITPPASTSGRKAISQGSVDVPTSVRDSDMGQGGPWVLIQPSINASKSTFPDGVAARRTSMKPDLVIPSSGDQGSDDQKKPKRSFGWSGSRKEKSAKDMEKVETGTKGKNLVEPIVEYPETNPHAVALKSHDQRPEFGRQDSVSKQARGLVGRWRKKGTVGVVAAERTDTRLPID